MFFESRTQPKRYNELRLPSRSDSPLSRNIEMVVVIVALQNNIDGTQIFESNPRCAMSPRSDPRKRTGAHGPYRVAQNIHGTRLNQDAGVAYESGSGSVAPGAIPGAGSAA